MNWATRERLNDHCNNKGLFGMKRRTATGFLHTFAIQAQSAILIFSESHELYMAVQAIEW